MIRKDLLFAVLTTFCLCALMFSVIPINSGLPYDPWTDINEDGTINMKDVGNVAAQFGTSGDPTKNVNVMNWPEEYAVFPKILRLYGVRRFLSNPSPVTYQNSLADHVEVFERLEPSAESAYSMSPGEVKVLNYMSIVSENSFARTFQVNGTAKIYWTYANGGSEWIYHNVTLSLQKILADGSSVPITGKNYTNVQGGIGTFSGYVYMNVTQTFYPGERIAIAILHVARNIQSYPIDVQTSIYFCTYTASGSLWVPTFNLYVELPIA